MGCSLRNFSGGYTVSPAVVLGRLDCTFDSDDYCGYTDRSDGSSKWVRSKEFREESPGARGRERGAGEGSREGWGGVRGWGTG